MDAVPLNDLPVDLQKALHQRATSEGKTEAEYVLELIRRDLNVTTWSAWLEQLSQDEPVSDADIASTLMEARQERSEELLRSVSRGEKL